MAKHLPAFQYTKNPVVAVEVFDARYNGFEIAKYHRQPQQLIDERGEAITGEMLKGKEIVLMNVIDQHPAIAKMYKSFSEQFALREVQGPKPSIELYHKETNIPIVDYQEVSEAKSSFLYAAESENNIVGDYVYGKEELQGFESVLEREKLRIGQVRETRTENSAGELYQTKSEEKNLKISIK